MKKNILIIGVILLVIGIILGALGPSLFTTSPELVAENSDTYSYSTGDTVEVYGEITDEGSMLGIYAYELNGVFTFGSSEDIGDVGDDVIVVAEYHEALLGLTGYWEATSTASPVPYMLPGIVLAIIGAVLLLLGLVKKENAPQQPVQNQYNPQYQQEQPYQQNEQAPPQQTQNYAPQPEYSPPPQEQNDQGPPKF